MWNEVAFARDRINKRIVTEATVMQAAMMPLVTGKNDAFKEITEQLNGR